jgi:hypothetical protein
MKGDRVEAVVDTGQGVQRFEIVASRAGRRIEVTTARGVVEVTEVTRSGTPVRTGRFMASRLIALVEHPALEGNGAGVDVTTRRRMGAPDGRSVSRARAAQITPEAAAQIVEEERDEPDPVDVVREAERSSSR